MGKMVLVYTLFAVIPMIFLTAYNYRKTSEILREESFQEMQQNMVTTGKSLESSFLSYSTIMDLLYTNQMLNSYLSVDYTDISYWDMFSYIDKQLHSITILQPNIYRINFYSTNRTLPQDNYYFYNKEALPPGFEAKASEKSGSTTVGGIVTKDGVDYLGFIRKLNYYSSGEIENYLVMLVDANSLNEQLGQNDSSRQMYLVDETGQVLAAGAAAAESDIGTLIPGWNEIPPGKTGRKITINGVDMIGMRREEDMGMNLLLFMDQESLLAETAEVTQRILFVFLLSSTFVFCAIWLYGKIAEKRVEKVVYAAKKLGDGQFDYVLSDMGYDEIGQIANAFNSLNERIQILIRENYEKKLLLKSSEMNLLQEQINPHFLYNALSVISSMAMREGGKKTVQSVRYLADFYRISLNKGRQTVSIQEELDLLQNYMKIQKLRFGDAVDITYDADREILPCRTIKLILQPLVENAIHHGTRGEEVLHIAVRAGQDGNRIFYEVSDDGLGIDPEKLVQLRTELKQSQEGFGLKNVDIRVKLNYGKEYGVTVNSVYGRGTCIRVEIPRTAGGEFLLNNDCL